MHQILTTTSGPFMYVYLRVIKKITNMNTRPGFSCSCITELNVSA